MSVAVVSVTPFVCVADDEVTTTYLPVTDDYQLDFQSRYIIVAKDYPVMAGEPSKNNTTRWGLNEASVKRNPDKSVVVTGEHQNSRYYLRYQVSSYSDEYKWEFHSYDQGSLITSTNKELSPKNLLRTSYNYIQLMVSHNPDGSTVLRFPGASSVGRNGFIRYFAGERRFRCDAEDSQEDVTLYREDTFGFKIDEKYESADDIRLTTIWKMRKEYDDKTPLKINYIITDGEEVTKDQLMAATDNVTVAEGSEILIPRKDKGSVLWVLGVYEPEPQGAGKGEFYVYSHIFRFDIPAPPKKVTGTEHFTMPKSDGYLFKDMVEFIKDSDVKIYYTTDGSNPVVPADGVPESSLDADETPLTYMGETISLKFIAVKDGYEPSEVISMTLTGEPRPTTEIGVHFKAPADKEYAIGEAIVFERDDDVKIYYTVDGSEPQIREGNGAGVTHAIDERPLVFDGMPLSLQYMAQKQDYKPSKVHSFVIEVQTSDIKSVEMEDSPATYYNLQGTRVTPPLSPGLYIERRGGGARKIVVH